MAMSPSAALRKGCPVTGLISPASPSISHSELVDALPPTCTEQLMETLEKEQRDTAAAVATAVHEAQASSARLGSPPRQKEVITIKEEKHHELTWQEKTIPFIVALSDLTRKIGAGMTTKFFPLFFINDYGFNPIKISVLYCAFPLSVAAFMRLVQRCSKPLGRAQAVSMFQFLGILALLLMCFVRNINLMVFLFLIRGGLMNAGFPIDRSIVNDYIPSRHRGKWNAVQSITGMTWSGSALFGGFLSDTHDYRYTFIFTAVIYVFALVIYTPLLWLVPRKEGHGHVGRLVALPTPTTPAEAQKIENRRSEMAGLSTPDSTNNDMVLVSVILPPPDSVKAG